ncbi:hypothetical protein, partial [uncultured Paracoccus sp.]|uniref:hypothetical protein n=1 Tax=uncultured Paracoccus sp. TaxID=189685 RepID=UPI00260CFE8D
DLSPRPAAGQCQPHRFTPKLRPRSVPVSHRTPPGSSVGALHFFRASPDSHRRQIERVVSIGAKIGVDQQKKHQDILKAITRSFDSMVDAMGEDERRKLFDALIGAATAADAKKIRQHPNFPNRMPDTSLSA